MVVNQETAVSGSEPEVKGQAADSPSVKDASVDSSTTDEKLPFDQHPKWKSARLAEKKLNEILEANDLTDIEDLVELVESGKKVKGKLTDVNALDNIIEKAMTLEKYEQYWAEQEERKRRTEEDPEDTIKRLERELKDKEKVLEKTEKEKKEIQEAKNAIRFYESEVSDMIKEVENISKDQRPFVLEFMGVNNPANEIDITDKRAIKRLVSDGIKKLETYDQQVIKNYLAGKTAVPKMGSATTGGEPEKPRVMLKDARKALRETFNRPG